MFSVNWWGSNPDLENDDCWTGQDFPTLEEALNFYNAEPSAYYFRCTEYIELDGPDIYQTRINPGFRPSKDDGEWEREIRMQAAMGGDY